MTFKSSDVYFSIFAFYTMDNIVVEQQSHDLVADAML